jgi:hypothetical protein
MAPQQQHPKEAQKRLTNNKTVQNSRGHYAGIDCTNSCASMASFFSQDFDLNERELNVCCMYIRERRTMKSEQPFITGAIAV